MDIYNITYHVYGLGLPSYILIHIHEVIYCVKTLEKLLLRRLLYIFIVIILSAYTSTLVGGKNIIQKTHIMLVTVKWIKIYISRSSVTPFGAELRRIIYSSVVSAVSIAIHNHKNNQRVKTYFSNRVFMCTILYYTYRYPCTYCAYDFLLRSLVPSERIARLCACGLLYSTAPYKSNK